MTAVTQPTVAPAPRRRLADFRVSVATGRGALLGIRHVTLLLLAGVVLLVGLTGAPDIRYGMVLATVYGVAVLANNSLAATLGEINLGTGAYIALGAYTTAIAVAHGWGAIPALIASFVLSAVAGVILAIPTSRLTGLATALVTFALAYSIVDLANYLKPITRGAVGRFLPMDLGIGGLVFNGSEPGMLVLAVIVMVLAGLAHLWLLHHRPGRIAIAVGESGVAASVFGTNVRLVRVAVWVWASALGGLAGGLYAMAVGYVSSSQWPIMMSLLIFAGGLIGGTRSATGAWLGGIIVSGIPTWLPTIVSPRSTGVFFGLVILLTLLAGGKGLAEFGERCMVAAYALFRRLK